MIEAGLAISDIAVQPILHPESHLGTVYSCSAVLDTAWAQSMVDVDQFYGIELSEFPARIAETALWMMDHIMNSRLSLEFGQTFVRIPLEKSPHIVHGDSLATCPAALAPRRIMRIRRSLTVRQRPGRDAPAG